MATKKARGVFTPSIKKQMEKFFGDGYEVTVRHLRLMPYLINALCDQEVHYSRVNEEELDILNDYVAFGYIKFEAHPYNMDNYKIVLCNKKFFNFVCRIARSAYVLENYK